MESGQKVWLLSAGAEVTVRQVRESGVVVVVGADGHCFGVVEAELGEAASEAPLSTDAPLVHVDEERDSR